MGRKRMCADPVTEENTSRRRNGEADGCLACKRRKAREAYVAKKKTATG